MRGITFHIGDNQEAARDKVPMLSNRELFLLGLEAAGEMTPEELKEKQRQLNDE